MNMKHKKRTDTVIRKSTGKGNLVLEKET